ncbi:MAG: beta-xylosidase [Acidobacteriaceae bacterium]|nr:beta-xylosidase [Acidobacteriaceae bacterium]
MRLLYFALVPVLAAAQVTIAVDASKQIGRFPHSWAYFGYDEPNYTTAPNGRRLIHELAATSESPIHIRTHFLLATGNGESGLKWGSTNAYTEDASGKPIYDWAISDKILSTLVDSGVIPLVEIGFMPRALSTHPDPYQPNWQPGKTKNEDYFIGWTYPPKDYDKWGQLVFAWVSHCVERFGRAQVQQWDWEVWNEPDIAYWHGTPMEYDKLYDYAAAAVRRAVPNARVGGPASTGPASPKAAEFLRQFLQHCSDTNVPLDFISFHAKGRPVAAGDHVRMDIDKELSDAEAGFDIVASYPQFQKLPVLLTEADPEGCAACSARVYPQNAYRNGQLYPAYEAAAYKRLVDLAAAKQIHLEAVTTWAFEFEGQPYFDGFRDLATNGIDKPVLNLFRMAGMVGDPRVEAFSSSAPSIDVMAGRGDRRLAILVWNYRDDDSSGQTTPVGVNVSGLPKRVLVRHYRIDSANSNSYTIWKQLGSPQTPTPEQYGELERAGQLALLQSPEWIDTRRILTFDLPLESVSLLELTW